jgi:hypothetical protein
VEEVKNMEFGSMALGKVQGVVASHVCLFGKIGTIENVAVPNHVNFLSDSM